MPPSFASIFAPGLFAGRVVVVTGGGSGIGRCASRLSPCPQRAAVTSGAGTAHELVALGASVAIVGRNAQKLDVVCEELRRAADGGDRCSSHVCDIRKGCFAILNIERKIHLNIGREIHLNIGREIADISLGYQG